jgi:hypothetical protein
MLRKHLIRLQFIKIFINNYKNLLKFSDLKMYFRVNTIIIVEISSNGEAA